MTGLALFAAASLASAIGCAGIAATHAPIPYVSVGPNVRVSRDARAPHVELTIAADSRDRELLIGAAIVVDTDDKRTATYVTRDRGATWTSRIMIGRDAVDPQVAFGITGTAYFVDLGPQLRALRSTDRGENWSAPVPIGRGYDHPQLGVDGSSGPYRGRVYAAVLDGRGWKLGVFQSADDGRSWTGPAVFVDGRGKIGARLMHGLASFAVYAVDTGARYRDRIYSVWPDESDGLPRVMFQYSADRGVTWSTPRMIDSSAGPDVLQYQPVVAVNRNGVVGVAWFDTRIAGDTTRYDEFFSASLDGGATFLPATRVSSESSTPRTTQNRAVVDRWLQGGDYAGLVADAGGDFHAFWPDSRSGTFEVYTARIGVRTPQP